MSAHDPLVTLLQMEDFIVEAQTLVRNRTLAAVIADPVLLRAFERLMELVGESVKRLPASLREDHQEVPWKKITGMRDVISHAYEDLMYEVLWDALQIHFPPLLAAIRSIRSELENEGLSDALGN